MSPITSAIGAVTIGVSLLLLGGFALLVENMEGVLDKLGDELFVTAYLEEGLTAEEEQTLEALVRTVEGVESVRLVEKSEALERFREGVGRGAALLEGLSSNPLPASLEIALVTERRSSDGMAMVVESIDGLDGVADLASGRDWVEGYLRAVGLVRGIGYGLVYCGELRVGPTECSHRR